MRKKAGAGRVYVGDHVLGGVCCFILFSNNIVVSWYMAILLFCSPPGEVMFPYLDPRGGHFGGLSVYSTKNLSEQS